MTNPTDGRWTSLQVFSGQLATSDLLSVVSPGNAAQGINYGLRFSNLATSIASAILPPNGATGTILFGQGNASAPALLPVSGDVLFVNGTTIATSTIATHVVTFAKMQQVTGPSIIGNVGTTLADLATITGTANQVLRITSNGTSVGFGQISLTAAAVTGFLAVPLGGTGTTAITSLGLVYGNGTNALDVIPAGTTAWPLVGNNATTLPSFQVLTIPGGGTGTTTLALNRVLIGNGTSTIASTNVATTGFPLVGNGTSAPPGFALLGVVGGGIGTGTTTPFAVLTGGTTATSQLQGLATTGASGFVLTSQGATALPIWGAAGAGTVTNVTGAGVATGAVTTSGSITVTAAAQSDMTTATSTTLVVTPGRQQFHPSAAKFWVSFNGANGSTLVAYNVTSVTRNSTGNYNVNLSTAFATTEFALSLSCGRSGGSNGFVTQDTDVAINNVVRVLTVNAAFATTDLTRVYVVGWGTQ